MTAQVPPPRPVLGIRKGYLHRFKTLDGHQFLGVIREFIEGPGGAVFVLDRAHDLGVSEEWAKTRWVSLAGLMWWELA